MSSEGSLDIATARSFFPSLSSQTSFIFADNAGGSQCCKQVIDRIADYLSYTNVQLGADYSVSRTSTDRANLGKEAARILFNASNTDEIALGSSSTALFQGLERAIEGDLGDYDEIITTGEHEGENFHAVFISADHWTIFIANLAPWKRLAKRNGLELIYWHPTAEKGSKNPYAVAYDVNTLLPMITQNTRIVTITACSNILGSTIDVKSVIKQVCVLAFNRLWWKPLTLNNRFAQRLLRKVPRTSRSLLIALRTPLIEGSTYRTGMLTTPC
jgi:selenocysteine lyase/cysteine desulfurase